MHTIQKSNQGQIQLDQQYTFNRLDTYNKMQMQSGQRNTHIQQSARARFKYADGRGRK